MYAPYPLLFGLLAIASLLAARRNRVFLLVALLGIVGVVDAAVWGIALQFGGIGIGLVGLAVATVIAAAEATSLPGPLARLTRLGIRSSDRDFDLRLWQLVGPLWSELRAGALQERTMRPDERERLLRSCRRLLEGLEPLRPPTDDWRTVRDAYGQGVRVVMSRLVGGANEIDLLTAFREAMAPALVTVDELRARYRPFAPWSPPWAVIALLLVYPMVEHNAFDLFDRAAEAVNPPAIAVGWHPMAIPFALGDGWAGNALTDGQRLVLTSREGIEGFWGIVRVRSSTDAGLSWTTPGDHIITAAADTARPAVALAPDGSIWLAVVRQGAEVATQQLWLGRSTDDGRNWHGFARGSPPTTGLVGLPALLVTPDVQLVAFTDGATGAAIIQPLYLNGLPEVSGPPITLGTTTRQLYSDANFLDAGIALAAQGPHVVALWHSSDAVIDVSVSDDAGRTWHAAPPLTTNAGWDRPQLAVVGGRFVALDVRTSPGGLGRWLELDRSSDGGERWTQGTPISNGLVAGAGWLDVSAGTWRLAYAACPGEIDCITPSRIWYRQSSDGQHWSDPQALTQPLSSIGVLGVGSTAGRTWVMWTRDPDSMAEHRVVEGLVR